MRQFQLQFVGGAVRGRGVDLIGVFVIRGAYADDGTVEFVKQYLGQHQVRYAGRADGEGSIGGVWTIDIQGIGRSRGNFLLHPVLDRPRGDETIERLTPRRG